MANGSTDWLVKAGAGAVVGAVVVMLLGQFVPQLQGMARLDTEIKNLKTTVANNTAAISRLSDKVSAEGEKTRAAVLSTVSEHSKSGGHPALAARVLLLESETRRLREQRAAP